MNYFNLQNKKIIFSGAVFATIFFAGALPAFAGSIQLTPAETDLTGLPRDILHPAITVKNTDSHRLMLYAFVYNIDPVIGKVAFIDPSAADKATSLANWIAITRAAITLDPGQSKTIDYEIDLGPYAKPGIYHAVIVFSDALTRDMAEQSVASMPQAAVNLQVGDDAHEILEIANFAPQQGIFFRGAPGFTLLIRNPGNRPETPKGEIRIMNSRGAEVASVPVNQALETIAPSSTKTFINALTAGLPAGSYKALVHLTYGPNDTPIEDIAFFWYIPWYVALILGGMLILIGGLLAFYVHARYMRWHHVQVRRLGIAHAPQDNNREEKGMVVDLRNPQKK